MALAIRITLGWVINRSSPLQLSRKYHDHIRRRPGHGFERTFLFIETLVRASLKTHLPGSPGNETKRVGWRTDVDNTDAPNIPPFRGGDSATRITLGWVIDRSFTLIAQYQVGNTFTRSCKIYVLYIYIIYVPSIYITYSPLHCSPFLRHAVALPWHRLPQNLPRHTTEPSTDLHGIPWNPNPNPNPNLGAADIGVP